MIHNHHGASYPSQKLIPKSALQSSHFKLTQKQRQAIKHRHTKKCRADKSELEEYVKEIQHEAMQSFPPDS